MSTTYTLDKLHPRRYVLLGDCDAPQGADGTGRLASSALAAMEAAAWASDDSAASMPVHDYDRERPSGDAFKAVYGYDKQERTQRACCGAVCYVVPMPAAPWAASGVAPASVEAAVTGDRYLDQGADVSIAASDSPDPLPWEAVLALPAETVCATSGQEDASGNQLKPNKRAGVSATVTAESPGRARFYHVYVRLHDYLGVRDAWIEGGAMLADIEIVFQGDFSTADIFVPQYSIPIYGSTQTGHMADPGAKVLSRYSSCGAIFGVVEFPTRFWGGKGDQDTAPSGAALVDAGAEWTTSVAAMTRLSEDIHSAIQNYGPWAYIVENIILLLPALCVTPWGGGLQYTDPAEKPANTVTETYTDGDGNSIVAAHIGYQLYDGSSPKVVGVGAIIGIPFRQCGAGRAARALRITTDISMGNYISVEIVAYKAPRPPQYWIGDTMVVATNDTLSQYPSHTCATPSAYNLHPKELWAGTATSINMRNYTVNTANEGPTETYSTLPLEKCLGRWEYETDIAANTELAFTCPVDDDECTILLCVRPKSFTRGGSVCPSHSSNCYINWPFTGYQFVLE